MCEMSQFVLGGMAKLIWQLLHSAIGNRTLSLSFYYILLILRIIIYFCRFSLQDGSGSTYFYNPCQTFHKYHCWNAHVSHTRGPEDWVRLHTCQIYHAYAWISVWNIMHYCFMQLHMPCLSVLLTLSTCAACTRVTVVSQVCLSVCLSVCLLPS